MYHRSGRTLAAAAVAAATAATAAVATSPAANAAPAAAGKSIARSVFGHQAVTLLRTPATAASPTTSTQLPAKFGKYPLHIHTLTTKVLAPLQLSASGKYGVLVADSAQSAIFKVGRNQKLTKVLGGPQPGEVAGVDVNARGDLAYTWTSYGKTGPTGSGVSIVRKGHKRLDVNLSAFEQKYNPDKTVTYGVLGRPSACVTDFLKTQGIPPSYTGMVDSHPYSVKAVPGGWVVADAAANDLIFVDNKGHKKVLAVVPRQGYTFTAATAAAAGLPACFAGVTYYFEGVPTDVELGPDGALYFTTLPGGPESPGLPRGSVYRFTLTSHHLRRLAGGFNMATNLAVTPSGRVLVTELGAGRISTIYRGHPEGVINLAGAVAVEFRDHVVYASTLGPTDAEGNPTGPGSVVAVSVRW
jgi:opacity protein-like surface antigen